MRFGLARAAARAAGNRMQGYRYFEFLARLPKRIIRSSGEGWFLRRCRAPDHGALEAPFLRVFQLADTVLYAVQRDERKSVKPGRIKSSESRDPIVVDSKAGPLQIRIGKAEQTHRVCWIQNFSVNTVRVLIFDSLGGI